MKTSFYATTKSKQKWWLNVAAHVAVNSDELGLVCKGLTVIGEDSSALLFSVQVCRCPPLSLVLLRPADAVALSHKSCPSKQAQNNDATKSSKPDAKHYQYFISACYYGTAWTLSPLVPYVKAQVPDLGSETTLLCTFQSSEHTLSISPALP